MANNQNVITFDGDKITVELEKVSSAADDLKIKVNTLRKALNEAFTIRGIRDYRQTAAKYSKDLANGLLTYQMRLGQLRKAIVDAVVPIGAVFIPALNRGVTALANFFRLSGQVLHALFLTGDTAGKASAGTDRAEKNQRKLTKSIAATGKAVRRSVAGFDELERLQAGSGKGRGGAFQEEQFFSPAISGEALRIADSIRKFLEPLAKIDFSGLIASCHRLWEALRELSNLIGEQLLWAWNNVLLPLGKWVVEAMAPATVTMLTAALQLLNEILSPVFAGIQNVAKALAPMAEFIQGVALIAVGKLTEYFRLFAELFEEKNQKITEIITGLGEMLALFWRTIEPILTWILEKFGNVFDGIVKSVREAMSTVTDVLHGLVLFISQVFAGNFAGAWETVRVLMAEIVRQIGATVQEGFSKANQSVLDVFQRMQTGIENIFGGISRFLKGAINGVIGFLNRMISGIVSGINTMVNALNKIHFTIPGWVPAVGGKSFGFHLSGVQTPRIPYLAQGAVLPANKPFLSVLGDQKHGTNIEAPLATIQQAVAQVMGDMSGGMMAGFEASVGVQKEILQAILGIQIGDDLISNAMSRYSQKVGIMAGGGVL